MIGHGWSDRPQSQEGVNGQPVLQAVAPVPAIAAVAPVSTAQAARNPPPTGPFMISCGRSANDSHPFNYLLDPSAKTVKTAAGKDLKVRSWDEDEIMFEEKGHGLATTPPITLYYVTSVNRINGRYISSGVWRTGQGKPVIGEDLATVARNNPHFPKFGLFSIGEPGSISGTCRVVEKKF